MRRVLVLLVILIVMALGYYAVNSSGEGTVNMGDVFIKLDKGVYSPTDTIVVTVVNRGNASVTTGYAFQLYKLEGEKWVEVPVKLAFIQVAVTVEPGKSWSQKVNLTNLGLKPGKYRIVKRVLEGGKGLEVGTNFEVKD
jgi:hypothetical protein